MYVYTFMLYKCVFFEWHAGIIVSPYTAKADSKVELLALHKTDFDIFMKEIRSSERREIFMVLRDNFLFENWTRLKLEKLTNLCKKKIFEQGEYLFRQGDRPDMLYILLGGTLDLVKEIFLVCKNSWPKDLNNKGNLVKRKTKRILLKTLTEKGTYFGEVSIIRDTTRTISIVAKNKYGHVLLFGYFLYLNF